MHYRRMKNNGTLRPLRRPSGEGAITPDGYLLVYANGRRILEQRLVAENALGKPLPAGAKIHHVNENRLDNRPENLIICPDHRYHALLHIRERAMAATGDPEFRKCNICKKFDAKSNMRQKIGEMYIHINCRKAYDKQRWAK